MNAYLFGFDMEKVNALIETEDAKRLQEALRTHEFVQIIVVPKEYLKPFEQEHIEKLVSILGRCNDIVLHEKKDFGDKFLSGRNNWEYYSIKKKNCFGKHLVRHLKVISNMDVTKDVSNELILANLRVLLEEGNNTKPLPCFD